MKFQDRNGAHVHNNIWSCLHSHQKVKLSKKSGVGFDINNILYEFNNLHHF